MLQRGGARRCHAGSQSKPYGRDGKWVIPLFVYEAKYRSAACILSEVGPAHGGQGERSRGNARLAVRERVNPSQDGDGHTPPRQYLCAVGSCWASAYRYSMLPYSGGGGQNVFRPRVAIGAGNTGLDATSAWLLLHSRIR